MEMIVYKTDFQIIYFELALGESKYVVKCHWIYELICTGTYLCAFTCWSLKREGMWVNKTGLLLGFFSNDTSTLKKKPFGSSVTPIVESYVGLGTQVRHSLPGSLIQCISCQKERASGVEQETWLLSASFSVFHMGRTWFHRISSQLCALGWSVQSIYCVK